MLVWHAWYHIIFTTTLPVRYIIISILQVRTLRLRMVSWCFQRHRVNKKRRLGSDLCLKDGKAHSASLGSEIPYLSLFCALSGQVLLHIASYFILTILPGGYWPSFNNGWQRRNLNLVFFDSKSTLVHLLRTLVLLFWSLWILWTSLS